MWRNVLDRVFVTLCVGSMFGSCCFCFFNSCYYIIYLYLFEHMVLFYHGLCLKVVVDGVSVVVVVIIQLLKVERGIFFCHRQVTPDYIGKTTASHSNES